MLLRDILYALRTLRKSPVFAATAILTIALGIGASTAIFSVTDAVLLRPLPYKNPDRLVFALADMRKRNVKDFFFSNPHFLDLRNASASVFEEIAAVSTGRGAVPREDGTPDLVHFGNVSTNFFRTMGAPPFSAAPLSIPTARRSPPARRTRHQRPPSPLGIISYNTGSAAISGNRDVIGRMIPAAPRWNADRRRSRPRLRTSSLHANIEAFPTSGSPPAFRTTTPIAMASSTRPSPA
jgi:putative ABC transport system permease protein